MTPSRCCAQARPKKPINCSPPLEQKQAADPRYGMVLGVAALDSGRPQAAIDAFERSSPNVKPTGASLGAESRTPPTAGVVQAGL